MTSTEPPKSIVDALTALGIVDAGEMPTMAPLTGGVSSEIWRVDLPSGPVVAKQALGRLRVDGEWRAPIGRGRYEVAWMRVADAVSPGSAPALLAAPDAAGCDESGHRYDDSGTAWTFVMAYLPPEHYRLWKTDLLAGRVDPVFGGDVGRRLITIHAATARDRSLADAFDNLELFCALRLDPYLEATAIKQPHLAPSLHRLRDRYVANRTSLVHGDISPKNILAGPDGPVFLDAECATWGDPTFDVAFCATHLLLKYLVVPSARHDLLTTLDAFTAAYEQGIEWEDLTGFWSRCAALVAGLLLARVDGLSPVEYLQSGQQTAVRTAATDLLLAAPATMEELTTRWVASIDSGHASVARGSGS